MSELWRKIVGQRYATRVSFEENDIVDNFIEAVKKKLSPDLDSGSV